MTDLNAHASCSVATMVSTAQSDEANLTLLGTAPTVEYRVRLRDGTEVPVDNPDHLPNPAEIEAILIQTILESNGIPCVVVGSAQYPSLGFEVRVPKSRLDEARAAVDEARQSGAAVEGESA